MPLRLWLEYVSYCTMDAAVVKARPLMPQFRVTLNSRCERACFYCRPSGEAIPTKGNVAVAPDDLIAVALALRSYGLESVKLTGGDPALYEPLEEVVHRLRYEAGFREVEVISRHPKLGFRARALADAGVTQFNISLDTLSPALYREICGVDDLDDLLAALVDCVATGVPCKINTVVMAGINEHELSELAAFCDGQGIAVLKFLDVIRDLDVGKETFTQRLARTRKLKLQDLYVPLSRHLEKFKRCAAREEICRQGDLGHPMTSLVMPSGMRLIFKDSRAGAWYGSTCGGCSFFPCHDALMALRLTADLQLQLCLLREDIAVPLKAAVRAGDATLRDTISDVLSRYSDAYFLKPQPVELEELGCE